MIAELETAATRAVWSTRDDAAQLVPMLTLIVRRLPTVSLGLADLRALTDRFLYQDWASATLGERTTCSFCRNVASARALRLRRPPAASPVGRAKAARDARAPDDGVEGMASPCPIISM